MKLPYCTTGIERIGDYWVVSRVPNADVELLLKIRHTKGTFARCDSV